LSERLSETSVLALDCEHPRVGTTVTEGLLGGGATLKTRHCLPVRAANP